MDLNQEDYEVAWWLETAGHERELLKEGVELEAKLLTARQHPWASLYNSLYLPIMQHDGCLPQHMNFAALCAGLDNVNPMEIDEHLRQIMKTMNSQINTKVAADILRLPAREVRRLIEKKVLPATKQDASWVIEYIDALRLAVKRLPAS
jgi:hypothetical protein